MKNKLNIVLYNPEIPQNTGNIIRSCYNSKADLHIIEPASFNIWDPKMKRASVTYVDKINITLYKNWEEFIKKNNPKNIFYTTKFGQKNPSDLDLKKNKEPLFLVFGAESLGIPKKILFANFDKCIRLPMKEDFRSFNLANTVSIMLYEYNRQNDFLDMVRYWDKDN